MIVTGWAIIAVCGAVKPRYNTSMQTTTVELVSLSREELLAAARSTLVRQAARHYAPEALPVVENIFWRNTAIMADEQLVHIIRRGEA